MAFPDGRAGYLFTFQDVTDHQAARARRPPAAAARGGRRDGRRHRARDPQSAGVDVRIDPGAARGAAAHRRAGAADGHRAARVGAAESDDRVVSRLRAAAALRHLAARRPPGRRRHRASCCATAPTCARTTSSTWTFRTSRCGTRPTRTRSGRSSGTWRPTACARWPTAAVCCSSVQYQTGTAAAGRRRPDRPGRGVRHSRRRARHDLPAVPQLVREGDRSRPGDRPSHRDRLQRHDPGVVDRRRRDDGARAPARATRAIEVERAGPGGWSSGPPYDAALAARSCRRTPDPATRARDARTSRASWSSTTSRRCATCCASCCAATATTSSWPRTARRRSRSLQQQHDRSAAVGHPHAGCQRRRRAAGREGRSTATSSRS